MKAQCSDQQDVVARNMQCGNEVSPQHASGVEHDGRARVLSVQAPAALCLPYLYFVNMHLPSAVWDATPAPTCTSPTVGMRREVVTLGVPMAFRTKHCGFAA